MLLIGYINFQFIRVRNLVLEVSNRPPQNHEVRIVLASDIHLGVSIDKKKFKQHVKLINKQSPDLVILAGDVSDNLTGPIIDQQMSEEFNSISAPLGVYAVSGNHEYMNEEYNALEKYLTTNTQVKYLRDSSVLVDNKFYIVGRDDFAHQNRKPLSELVCNLDESKPVILVDHQPRNLPEAEENNISLQLSGHTHNGQIFSSYTNCFLVI